ncbi:MAG: thioredoxin family protein [Pseudomonadota bacterium]
MNTLGPSLWMSDAGDAFAQARERGVPVLLYWGAGWCPPCNRVKATIFNRPDFAARAGAMVALHVDGDSAGAQQMAERFKMRSYPTLIVFRPDGSELTRLPCEVDGERFVQLLDLALRAPFSVAQSMQAVLSGERTLGDDEWRMLAYYAWDCDERQVLGTLDLATTLARLTRTCTLDEASVRLEWHALHAACEADRDNIDKAGALAHMEAMLADPLQVRAQRDIVTNYAGDLVRYLAVPQSEQCAHLAAMWAQALVQLETDPTVTLPDQLAALRARVRVSRLGLPIEGLNELAHARIDHATATVNEPALRHIVMNTAAGILSDAGLLNEAESLLLAELNRSHAPFYFMHNLATIAKKRGDPLAAVSWYEQAWKRATGSATRLQWGTTYLHGLIDFAPHDAARIEQVARVLLREVGETRDAYFQRNRMQMQRIDRKLATWGEGGEYAAALRQAARVIPNRPRALGF